ncbi:E2 ubiquitin-conjugating protein mms2 [Coemansia sp. S100]|nr:E2 ubiquitin-conjugating protein mms2 [Coemansia sp. S100]
MYASTSGKPRNFRLLDELEKSEKGVSDGSCTYGLENAEDDIYMVNWVASILGPHNTQFQNRIYTVKLTCGMDYPKVPPTVVFETKINLGDVVKADGTVDPKKLEILNKWEPTSSHTLLSVLIGLRQLMGRDPHRKSIQPEEGTKYADKKKTDGVQAGR